jgi:PAS domain S-box-containing protein
MRSRRRKLDEDDCAIMRACDVCRGSVEQPPIGGNVGGSGGQQDGRATFAGVSPQSNFFALAESLEVAIFVAQGTALRYANPAAARMTGYTNVELLQMEFWEFIHPEHQTIARERGLARQAGVEVPRHVEYMLCTKTGATVWVDFSGARIEYDGAPALLGTAVDITAYKQVEAALRRSEARLRRLVDSNVLGVLIGDLSGRILEANDGFLSMLGYTAADLPLRWDELTPPEWRLLNERAVRALRETGIAAPWEKEYVHRDGHRVPVLIGIALLEPGGETTICFVIDLTDRKRAERALAASLAEQRASEEKLRRFAAREVAVREAERKRLGFDLHDNVCQELIGVGMLVASVRQRLGPERGDLAIELARASHFLAELVEHLRLLARELRPLQLRDLGLEESLHALAIRMSSPTTSVVARVTSPVPRVADEVEMSMYRVAQEALANALRHAEPSSIALTLVVHDGRIRLEVHDDGCGFDPTRRPSEALGLTSMEERALALGGRLSVESAPGAGTTIAFECPIVRDDDGAPR